jgi:hypothetical protein
VSSHNEQYVDATDNLPACRALLADILESLPEATIVVPRHIRRRLESSDRRIEITERQDGALVVRSVRSE